MASSKTAQRAASVPPPRLDTTALQHAPLFSEELGIDLASRSDPELFKWFLASMLYGARITAPLAARTFQALVRHGLLSPESLLDAGQETLVHTIMREGHYVRYDESKSHQLLVAVRQLQEDYGGLLSRLHEAASDEQDLEKRLDAFYGVGPVMVNIFLRELRPFWAKADPAPLPAIIEAARDAGLDLARWPRKSLTFARIEAGFQRQRLLARPKAKAALKLEKK